MPTLRSPAVYIPALQFGKPISLGFVYILSSGVSVPSNKVSVQADDLAPIFYNDESGNQIAVSQPLNTSKGGCIYSDCSDEVRQFYTSAANYIFAVYDSNGALQYYDTMSDTFGGNSGGGAAGAATIIDDWNLAITPGFYQDSSVSALNQPVIGRRFIGWVANNNEAGDSVVQFVGDVTQVTGPLYARVRSVGVFGAWRQVWDSSSFTKQSSFTDTTVNAALLVGGFGIGGNGAEFNTSVNSLTATGFYSLGGSASDIPLGATASGSSLLHINYDSGTACQVFIEFSTGESWVRAKNASWATWRRTNQTALISKSASYQLENKDFGATVRFSGGSTATLTVVPDIGYDGGLIQVINRNSGDLTLLDSGVTLTWLQGGTTATGSRTLKTGSVCTLIRISNTEFEITGLGLV